MKHVGNILKTYIETNGIPKQDVASAVGIAYNYLSTIFNKPSIKSDLLEKFCNALHLSPMIFFEVEEGGSGISYKSNNTVHSKNGNAALNIDSYNGGGNDALLAEKERVIASQAETIAILKQMLNLKTAPGNGTDSGQVQ